MVNLPDAPCEETWCVVMVTVMDGNTVLTKCQGRDVIGVLHVATLLTVKQQHHPTGEYVVIQVHMQTQDYSNLYPGT